MTAETLSDAEILRYGRTLRDGTATDAIGRHQCIMALGLSSPSTPAARIVAARARIAAAINARADPPA